jgi:DNA/RNA-binding domain of Phe-tRNA-synthetase-like protein
MHKDLLAVYPELVVQGFCALVEDQQKVGSLPVLSTNELRAGLESSGISLETLAQQPLIAAWRSAFQMAGLKASTFKSSPDALARRVLKGASISTPLTLVNLYCAVSVEALAPLGAYDLDRLAPRAEIQLRFAQPPSDHFSPLGGRPQDFPLSSRVPVYAIDNDIICWAFNCRDSDHTCLVDGTAQLLFMGEAVTSEQREALRFAMKSLRQRLTSPGISFGPLVEATAADPVAAFLAPTKA